ncbi:MAG: hypothetical protein CMC91_04095 [Flavobacteriaceae bacterium]|nr:hypothetical protein [Flavobacteriaceae bacterium]|tara:strand:- start:3286 stop:3792 length:507 start_codon:yes stop_codon:yes gene_type:complete
MNEPIVNRVAESKLITFDLQEFCPNGERVFFDISEWLEKGLVLKEKKFRDKAKGHAWGEFKGKYVAIDCSTDAIIPAWAPLLIASYLNSFAKEVVFGDLEMLENHIFKGIIDDLNLDLYRDKPIIIKGCSEKEIPENVFIQLLARFQKVAKSIFYGEACSSVPIWKKA